MLSRTYSPEVRTRLNADPWAARDILVIESVDPWAILLDARDDA